MYNVKEHIKVNIIFKRKIFTKTITVRSGKRGRDMSAEAVFFCFLTVDGVTEILLCSYSLNVVHIFYLQPGYIFHEENCHQKKKKKIC